MMRILKPDDYMARSLLDLGTTPDRERLPEMERAIFERFGPEMVEHFKKFRR